MAMKSFALLVSLLAAVVMCSNKARAQTPPTAPAIPAYTLGTGATNQGGFGGSPDQPAPRRDTNSQLAHQQLLEKAKKGGIDIYFEGDSITRRWGTSDEPYKANLANWTSNFFGWNAADFGWGADQIQNILWRLENGELDGVNPKIIVVLAGVNNINGPLNDERTAGVERGIKKILDVCQAKAPNAVIILTAIFPRNDRMTAVPAIFKVDEDIAKLADGKKIRFVDINGKLADKDGHLFDGLTVDRLHPTVKGYQIWADALKPIFTELLGPPAATDHAPPPTGDPSAAKPAAPGANSANR
jgi:lysophospholipase L1-like esterase